MAKFDPFLSLDCARVEGVGAQSKERKGSNFAAQRSGAMVLQDRRAKHIRSQNLAIAIWQPCLSEIGACHFAGGEVQGCRGGEGEYFSSQCEDLAAVVPLAAADTKAFPKPRRSNRRSGWRPLKFMA